MQRIELPAPEVVVDGAPIDSCTLLAYAGAHQLTLSTTLAALGIELHSSYLGHRDAANSTIAHLLLTPDAIPRTSTRTAPGSDLPISVGRRRCLLDHLTVLQDAVAARYRDARVTVDERALDRVEHA